MRFEYSLDNRSGYYPIHPIKLKKCIQSIPGGRPRFLGTTLLLGVTTTIFGVDFVVVVFLAYEVGVVGVTGPEPDESISFGVGTTPGLSENRTDFRGMDPDDLSADAFKIGRVGVSISTIC